jgi:hypothetical protein
MRETETAIALGGRSNDETACATLSTVRTVSRTVRAFVAVCRTIVPRAPRRGRTRRNASSAFRCFRTKTRTTSGPAVGFGAGRPRGDRGGEEERGRHEARKERGAHQMSAFRSTTKTTVGSPGRVDGNW